MRPFAGDCYTQPRKETDTEIESVLDQRTIADATLSFGTVSVTEQVTAFQRKRVSDHMSCSRGSRWERAARPAPG